MDFWQSLALLGRRWRFFGVALVLAIVLTGGVYQAVKPQYQATTEILLVPPSISLVNQPANSVSPYDNYGSLNTVASILSDAESSQQAADRLKTEGLTDTYTVSTDPTGAVPELILAVTADSPAAALTEVQILTHDAQTTLRTNQLSPGVNTQTFVTTQYLAKAATAPKDDKSRLRVGVAAGVVLVFLAVALTFLYDAMMRRRAAVANPAEGHVTTLRAAQDIDEPAQEVPVSANGRASKLAVAQPHVPGPGRGSAPSHVAQDR